MARALLRLLRLLVHTAFWGAVIFVSISLVGFVRWAQPGGDPSPAELLRFGENVLAAFALFTLFYLYDTFSGEEQD
jgi:hypothetical protein